MEANINGEIVPFSYISNFQNSSFKSGIGLIETMLWTGEKVLYAKEHFKRLWSGAERLQMDMSHLSEKKLLKECEMLVYSNIAQEKAMIRLQLFLKNEEVGYLIEIMPFPTINKLLQNEIKVGIIEEWTITPSVFSPLKTSNRLLYEMASRHAKRNQWYDALLMNSSGRIAEGSFNNIFWVKGNSIFTPPLTEGCVAGIMRAVILNASIEWNVQEQILTLKELKDADEVFLCNSVRGLQPVECFESIRFRKDVGLQLKERFF